MDKDNANSIDPILELIPKEQTGEFIKEVERRFSDLSLLQLAKENKLSEVPDRIKQLKLKYGKTSALLSIKFRGFDYSNTTLSVEVHKERMTDEQFENKLNEHKMILFKSVLNIIKLCAG